MKTHTLTLKTKTVNNNNPKTQSLRERIEDWMIRKMLGRIKD